MDQYSKINLNTKKILYYILLSGGFVALSILAPKLPYELLKVYLKNKKLDRRKFSRDFKRLIERGDIRIGKDRVSITRQGKERVLHYRLDEIKIKPQNVWDKKWRLVVFDIPDHQKKAANTLRKKLEDLGFLSYQKSVFINPYPCRDEIDFVKEIFEVGSYTKMIIAAKIDDEEYFLRKFHLID